MTRIAIAAAVIATFLFAPIASAQVKAGVVAVDQSEAIVTLVSLDQKTRTAIVRAPNGIMLSVSLPQEAQNLDRLKAGDQFKMRYVESLAVALNKGGSSAVSDISTVQVAPKGGTPGGRMVNTKRVAVSVQAIDRGSRTLVVQDPNKKEFSLKVADDVKSFADIAVGDTISVTYTEALAIEMVPQGQTPPPAKAAK